MIFGSDAVSKSPQFVPDDRSRSWLAASLADIIQHLGEAAMAPRWLADPQPRGLPLANDLDSLFDLVCGLQAEIGQRDLEFTLLEMEPGKPAVPPGFEPLGDPTGHLMHTFARGQELVLLASAGLFRVRELLMASIARELGRMGLWQAGPSEVIASIDDEAAAELGGVALGMAPWLANGAYIFENACCGGGCGLNLREIKAGLSLPEICYALALDARRKGIGRWGAGKGLGATQKAAFKASWGSIGKGATLAALAAAGGERSLGA
ncbi:MAG: hypothetical protein H6710_20190 [Myxococcales bacterium]|nr:hypothetical protein [Myxococcales bacterium]